MSTHTVGVLALQGAFSKHIQVIKSLHVNTQEVRSESELSRCDALIIPGGESTTMMRLINFSNLREPLVSFAQEKPVFGTCAGIILLSKEILSDKMQPLGILDISIERNAFGRQIESFSAEINLFLDAKRPHPFHAFFIRAPRIKRIGPSVQVLASFNDEPILVKQGHIFGATFHPELTGNPLIHQHFLKELQ